MSFGPRSVARPVDAGVTALGTLDAGVVGHVDAAGCVQLLDRGWTLDWWVGGEDRWHVPAVESSVRQRRIGAGPVVETMARVPGGDVVQRCGAVVAGASTGVTLEIENTTSSAVAIAVAVRPVGLDGRPAAPRLRFDGAALRIDDDVLIAERSPVERSLGADDLAPTITTGQVASGGPAEVSGAGANGVLVFPLPHTATIRLVVAPGDGASLRRLPDLATVADGWDTVASRHGTVEFPDDAVTALAAAARSRLLIDGGDARGGPSTWWPMTSLAPVEELGVAMVDAADRHRPMADAAEATSVLEAFALFAANTPGFDDRHLELLLDGGLGLLRSVDRRRTDRDLVRRARLAMARLADRAGQADAVEDLLRGLGAPPTIDDPATRLTELVESTGDAGRFGPNDDPVAAENAWRFLRRLLVTEAGAGPSASLDLAPGHLGAWRGGSMQVLGLPTSFGPVSFAIRWHGERPALLWEFWGEAAVELRCSALDGVWSTTERSGETLLSGQRGVTDAAPAEGDSFS